MHEGTHATPALTRQQLLAAFGLIVAGALNSTGQIMLVTLSALIGAAMSPTPELATLPVTTGVLGLALASLPAAALIRRFGRRPVFALSSLWGAAGVALASISIHVHSFAGFSLGCFIMGNNAAVVAQYRFALADIVPPSFVSRAVSYLMLGVLAAALVTPWVALRYQHLLPVEFSGSFAVLPVALIAAAVIVALLPMGGAPAVGRESPTAPTLGQILSRPGVQLAMLSAAVGYGVMSLIMTATPISMHVMDHYSVEVTADVIRVHLLAMFAPSLVTGWLITRLGVSRMLWTGMLLEVVCVAIAVSGQEVWHYRFAMIALGIGWNLLFLGGTTLLAQVCHKDELLRVQGINDFVMFTAMVVTSLFAGVLIEISGWMWVNLIGLALLMLIVISLIRGNRLSRAAGQVPE